MTNPELSRKVAKLFNQYKVPIDLGFKWAYEADEADSVDELSPELRDFIENPRDIKSKPNS
tara:strand:+ start:5105 stop:5287 length:183 start_codon:yes stop_codon:yes gene_type:complete